MANGRLIVVCGLAAEAKIAVGKIAVGRDAGDSMVVIPGGGDQARLASAIEAAAVDAVGILSFGVAGGLAPNLRPGDVRVADLVIAPGGELFTPDPAWAAALRSGLVSMTKIKTSGGLMVRRAKPVSNHAAVESIRPSGTLVVRDGLRPPHHEGIDATQDGRRPTHREGIDAIRGGLRPLNHADDGLRLFHQEGDKAARDMALARFAGVDAPLADVAGKAALHRTTGADLVDMETHIVARVARRHGLPFAALRAVTDPAHRSLPHAATVGMKADGSVDLAAILQSLRRDPGQLPGLIRTGLDARAAFAALFRCRQLLGARFALLDL